MINRQMLEKICDPNISILKNITMLRENWLKYKDLDNAVLYLHPSTYDRLLAENSGAIYYMDFGATKIKGIKIKVTQRVRPYHLLIREEDNSMRIINQDTYNYCNIMASYGKTNKVLNTLPTRYIINDNAVILFWSDGDKTVVKKAKDDNNDPVKGFLWAYFIKHSKLSKTKANKYLKDLVKED